MVPDPTPAQIALCMLKVTGNETRVPDPSADHFQYTGSDIRAG